MRKFLKAIVTLIQVLTAIIFFPAFLLAYAGLFALHFLDNIFKKEVV